MTQTDKDRAIRILDIAQQRLLHPDVQALNIVVPSRNIATALEELRDTLKTIKVEG